MFGRNPEKLEAKALDYERRGKTAKALKYREKAARLRSNQSGGVVAPLGTTGLQQRPPVATVSGVDRNRDGIPDQLQQGGLQQRPPVATVSGVDRNRDGIPDQLQQGGFQQGFQQQGFQQQGFQQGFQPSALRTPQRYEQNALKWEQRGNWQKAQKNREKVWRLNNPQHAQYAAPMFYQQNRFLGYNVPFNPATAQPFQGMVGHHQVMAATVETHVHPTIVEQTTRPERIVEVQPVIHRQVDAPQVRVIEKHLYETVASTGPGVITNAPIVEEVVRPRIIEEVQNVVHREVPAPFVERVEQHVTEHITQPTTTTKQVINDPTVRNVGLAAGGPPMATVSGVDRNRDGIPDALQQGGANQPRRL